MTTELQDYRVEIDDQNFKATTYFPGVTYDDFDRSDNITPWKICRMFEAGRAIPFYKTNFLDFHELYSPNKSSYFVLGGDYRFDSCLWQMRRTQFFPYKITTQLIGVGQTSLTIRSVLTNLLDNKELASYNGIIVYMDIKSKRPQELPSWHREKYRNIEATNKVRINSSVPNIPGSAYSTKLQVCSSDTDHNGHTNQSCYIRFCLDVTESARRKRMLQHFSTDVCQYPVQNLSVAYLKETLVGDELTLFVWEDKANPSMLYFVIKCGSHDVFVGSISFRENPSSKL